MRMPNSTSDETELPSRPLRQFDSVWKRVVFSAFIGLSLGFLTFAPLGADVLESSFFGLTVGTLFGIIYGTATWAFRPYKSRHDDTP
ncbi:MAG: hypothetical protein U0744_03175 [Gemmataceae bacterium]